MLNWLECPSILPFEETCFWSRVNFNEKNNYFWWRPSLWTQCKMKLSRRQEVTCISIVPDEGFKPKLSLSTCSFKKIGFGLKLRMSLRPSYTTFLVVLRYWAILLGYTLMFISRPECRLFVCETKTRRLGKLTPGLMRPLNLWSNGSFNSWILWDIVTLQEGDKH